MSVPCLCYSTSQIPSVYWIIDDRCQYDHQIIINLDILQLNHSVLRGNQQPPKDPEFDHQTQVAQSHTQTIFQTNSKNAQTI